MARLAWTIRYLAPSQLIHRARLRAIQFWWRFRRAKAPWGDGESRCRPSSYLAGARRPELFESLDPAEMERARSVVAALGRNEFRFLNRTRRFEGGIDWQTGSESHLWRYHLHYFDYLEGPIHLRAASNLPEEHAGAYAVFRRLILDWIQSHESLGGDGWHPYTLSLRLVNWLDGIEAFEIELADDPAFRRQLIGAIEGQARVLARCLEFDVRGNHLIENLRALIWVGTAFDTPQARQWHRKALGILEPELARQVLGDGGHYERSPGYHVVVLRRLIEMARRTAGTAEGTPAWLIEKVRAMLSFLRAMRTPGGSIPLLKDSTDDVGSTVDEVLTEGALLTQEPAFAVQERIGVRARLVFGTDRVPWTVGAGGARPQESTEHRVESGYVLSRAPADTFFVLDVGRPCPDELPAHAHADIFTFELWVKGKAWIVDSGVFEYAAGPWRDYFRSTRAHNTVEVDGMDQSDVYSSFRVGRRARVHGARMERFGGEIYVVQAYHDGYAHRGGVHRRVVVFRPGMFWVFADQVTGSGRHEIRSYVHFDVAVRLERSRESAWGLVRDGEALSLSTYGYGGVQLREGVEGDCLQGWQSRRFGEREAHRVLELSMGSTLPSWAAYGVSTEGPVTFESLTEAEGVRFRHGHGEGHGHGHGHGHGFESGTVLWGSDATRAAVVTMEGRGTGELRA